MDCDNRFEKISQGRQREERNKIKRLWTRIWTQGTRANSNITEKKRIKIAEKITSSIKLLRATLSSKKKVEMIYIFRVCKMKKLI